MIAPRTESPAQSVENNDAKLPPSALDCMSYRLPALLHDEVRATLEEWRVHSKAQRVWTRDASLWTGHDEDRWLDWLHISEAGDDAVCGLLAFAGEARRAFKCAIVLGMGGSSLCPDVLSSTFGRLPGYPALHVLDSTDPAQIRATEGALDLSQSLFIVSSKSGTTLEPNMLKDYFYDRVRQSVGEAQASRHFIVITDAGSVLEETAKAQAWRVFCGVSGIGGRYSALSNFGMVPAAVMGLDVPRFLDRARSMADACGPSMPPDQNPGVLLGTILGIAAKSGRDKVTLVASPVIAELGAWLEQLLAESTGKEKHGIVPVDREPLGASDVYGADRLFVYLRLDGAPDAGQDAAIDLLERAGHAVVRVRLGDPYDLGREFFRWEFATAVASSILGVNAFNQPDVEASKVATRKLTDVYEKTGALPQDAPFYQDGQFQLFADDRNRIALERAAGADKTLHGFLRAHLGRLTHGDYFALLAYVQRNDAHDRLLQAIRGAVRDSRRVATCVGFGPRFLHSTGQAYKGGPNSGVFLQLTSDEALDVEVPAHRFTFGVVKSAQARGDFLVLAERDRRALRVHLGEGVTKGLGALRDAIERALA